MSKIVFVYKGRYFVRDTETIAYLSALARSAGRETALVYDPDVFGVTDNVVSAPALNRAFSTVGDVAAKILDARASTAVFLMNFGNAEWIESVTVRLKKSRFRAGSAVPPEVVVVSPLGFAPRSADIVLAGEPEKVFADFVGAPAPGLGRPLPDKDLFASCVNFTDSYMVYASRGCAGNCSYCEETIYKNAISGYCARRSAADVIDEIKRAKEKYGCREIIFKDADFAADRIWLAEFLAAYRKDIGVPFKCFGRSAGFDLALARELKSGGCYCIEFGVQTLNEKIRAGALFRRETAADVEAAFRACDEAGLDYDADHMFGLPGESAQDHVRAAEFYALSGFKRLNRIKCHNLVRYSCAGINGFAGTASDGDVCARDFFSGISGRREMMFANAAFQKFFKVLPVFGPSAARFMLKRGLWKFFYFVPSAAVMFAQAAMAVARGDRRFEYYIKNYPGKIRPVFASRPAGAR